MVANGGIAQGWAARQGVTRMLREHGEQGAIVYGYKFRPLMRNDKDLRSLGNPEGLLT